MRLPSKYSQRPRLPHFLLHPILWLRAYLARPERSTELYDELRQDLAAGKVPSEQREVARLTLQTFGFNLRLERKVRRQRIENRVLYVIACLFACVSLWQLAELNQTRTENLARSRAGQLATCNGNNEIREESNRRVAVHEADARNLGDLLVTLAANRRREARAFRQLGETFGIPANVRPLVRALKRAAKQDAAIAATQRRLTFKPLEERDCTASVPNLKP